MYNINLLQNPQTRMQAFAEMVNDLTPKLYTHIRRLVQYHDDADDVLQNTFMKAWQALDTFRGDCQIFTWLYRIATNDFLAQGNDKMLAFKKKTDYVGFDDKTYNAREVIAKYFTYMMNHGIKVNPQVEGRVIVE